MAIYKLGDICQKIFVGKDMPESFGLEKSKLLNVPVVANGIGNSQIMGYTDNSITTEETISISARGTIGYVSFWTEPIHPIVRLLVIVPKNDIVLPKFLFYKLRLTNFLATGAVQKQLTKPDLEKITLEIPSLSEQQAIIDIIEPVEAFENNISKLVRAIELLTKNLESNSGYVFGDFVSIIKNKPKNIKQVSAKVLNRRTSLISQLENPNTYTTNNFFAPKGTLVINTIRTYLEKFGLLYDDADANGTLAMFEMKDATSVFHNLLNDDFWSQALLLSHGTKMPVIKTKDLLSINARKTETEIVGLQNLLISLATLSTRISNLKNRLINLLII